MTTHRYYLDGFGTEAELTSLKAEDIFPLIRELEFKFGLKVLKKVESKYQLCNEHGLAVAKVWAEKNMESGKMEYYYRSPYYKKARGASERDKQTLCSVKISSLIATLKKQKVIPDPQVLTNKKIANTKGAVTCMKEFFGKSDKDVSLSADEIHALLINFFGEKPESHGLVIDTNKCKNILDTYNNIDRIRDEKRQEVNRAFRKPYYLIGVDEYQHLIIGKFKIVSVEKSTVESFGYTYETVAPFKRYPSVEAYPELIPLMTMVKVAYEGHPSKHGIFPLQDKYDNNLDMTFSYNTRPTHYDCLWMTTPCSDT